MIIKKVNRTSVSTKAKLNSIGVKIFFAAPGFRAIPSSAAAPILPCASPQPNAAIPMPNAAEIHSAAWPPAAPAALSCENAAGANIMTAIIISNSMLHYVIDCLLINCCQEVVPGHRAAGLTLEQQIAGNPHRQMSINAPRLSPSRDKTPAEQ